MDALQTQIARYLASRAASRTKTTYQQVASAIGWRNPTGRGLGRNLGAILRYFAAQELPPLTTILVEKGKNHPSEEAMNYIREFYRIENIDQAQEAVFDFDWTTVPELALLEDMLPHGRDVWLTSFWGFDPSHWGYIGFADEWRRKNFIQHSKPGVLVAIYVTKSTGPFEMRGKVVGILELSHETGHAKDYISGDRWREKELDPASKGKWLYAVKATRAWRVVPEQYKIVDDIFPDTYQGTNPELIGANGVRVLPYEAAKLFDLQVQEVPVYGNQRHIDTTIQSMGDAVAPSRAVLPASHPYIVGETDGPKHLYILRLNGNIPIYLGCDPAEVDEKSIIKVGFSKSPLTRRDNIQSSYPHGTFSWSVLFPKKIPDEAPFSNASVAIAGEDAMKRKLVNEGARVLGGEFFLAEDWLVHKTWAAGNNAAQEAEQAARQLMDQRHDQGIIKRGGLE